MTIRHLAIAGLMGWTSCIMVGCAGRTPEPVPVAVPVTADALAGLRTSFAASHPNARLGTITEVSATDPFLSLASDSADDFPLGSTITLIDTNGTVLGHGKVVRVVGTTSHVKFDTTGVRGPAVGDVGIRF